MAILNERNLREATELLKQVRIVGIPSEARTAFLAQSLFPTILICAELLNRRYA
jgi:hypothetical protein